VHTRTFGRTVALAAVLALAGALVLPAVSYAKSAREIDAGVNATLVKFKQRVQGASTFLQGAQAVLVFPGVVQAGLGVGGEFGEGALRIHGSTVRYYTVGAASAGFQWGAQVKDIIIVFLQRQALANFRARHGWTVGVDGSVVVVNLGANASINTTTYNAPVVGFIVGQEGLMYDLSLQGTKMTPFSPK
jgi:lipid-binding SYLF domain-containing protein